MCCFQLMRLPCRTAYMKLWSDMSCPWGHILYRYGGCLMRDRYIYIYISIYMPMGRQRLTSLAHIIVHGTVRPLTKNRITLSHPLCVLHVCVLCKSTHRRASHGHRQWTRRQTDRSDKPMIQRPTRSIRIACKNGRAVTATHTDSHTHTRHRQQHAQTRWAPEDGSLRPNAHGALHRIANKHRSRQQAAGSNRRLKRATTIFITTMADITPHFRSAMNYICFCYCRFVALLRAHVRSSQLHIHIKARTIHK